MIKGSSILGKRRPYEYPESLRPVIKRLWLLDIYLIATFNL